MSAHEAEVASALRAWYGGSAQHLWRDSSGKSHPIDNARGFDQGDPLPPAGFAVAQRERWT
eukprot:7132663-Pyramimonas_sp.AAC.1